MPLIPLEERDEFTQTPEVPDLSPQQPVQSQTEHSTKDISRAAFRQHNTLGSFGTSNFLKQTKEVDPNFDLHTEIQGTEYEDDIDKFLDVHNKHDFDLIKEQIQRERVDRQVLRDSGWTGTSWSFIAALLGPENLIPGTMAVRAGKQGYSITGSAARVGAASGGSATIAEGILQSTQTERTTEESLYAIGGATLLGGFLGGGLAKLSNRGLKSQIAKQLDLAGKIDEDFRVRLHDAAPDDAEKLFDEATSIVSKTDGETIARVSEPGSVGAAAHAPSLDELSVYGKAAGYVAEKTKWLNPILRLLHSSSPAARNLAQNIFEQPIYMKMNDYRPSATAVESVVRRYTEGILPEVLERVGTAPRITQGGTKSMYNEMRKAGMNMTRQEFRQAIGRALRRGDKDNNPFVQKAAQEFRGKLFEPMRKELEKLGFDVPAEGKSTTADSYLPRMWNVDKLVAGETNFRRITKDWLVGGVTAQLEREMAKLTKKLDALQREIDDIDLTSLRRNTDMQERFGVAAAEDFTQISNLEQAIKVLDEIVQAVSEGRPIAELISSLPDDVQKIVGEVAERLGIDDELTAAIRADLENQLDAINTRIDGADVDIKEDDILNMLKTVQEGPPEQPQTLMQFLKGKGGLIDPDGELRALGIAQGQKGVPPGFIRKFAKGTMNPDGGMTLDDAARAAWEEGFFPGTERPTVAEFLDALGDDFSGFRPVVRAVDQEAADAVEAFRVIETEIQRLGVDASRPRLGSTPDQAGLLRALNKAQDDAGKAKQEKLKIKQTKLQDEIDELKRYEDPDLFEQYLNEITDNIFNKLTGRHDIADFQNLTENIKGPMKNKSFKIPDKNVEWFLEDDIEMIAHRYARIAGAQIEFKRKFGTLDLKDHYAKITEDYDAARNLVNKTKGLTKEQKELETARLFKEEKEAIRDLKFGRDKLLGDYEHDVNSTLWSRTVDSALAFNYVRAMGGVTLTSAPDIFRTVSVHGLGRVFGKGLAPFIAGSRGVKINRQLAKKLAGIGEITSNSRAAMNMDLANPYAVGTPFERFMQNMTKHFSTLNGLAYWNQYLKEFTGHITIDRVLGNALKKKLSPSERRYMNMLGIGEDIVSHIRKAHEAGAVKKIGGVWTIDDTTAFGEEISRTLFAGIAKDINSTVITKGIGDVPLFMNHPLGKLVMQFKSFAMATHQRILLRGLQEDQTKFLMGLAGMVITGMFVYYLKQLESGREVSDNPGTWLAEGIDRSGVFALFFEANNMFEKNGGPGVYNMLASAFPDKSQRAPASRYAIRSQTGSLLGPTFGGVTDAFSLLSIGTNAVNPFNDKPTDVSPGQIKAARRLTPFASLPYWRWYIDGTVVPAFQDEVR